MYEKLKLFRQSIFERFPFARDAAMNLLDALCSHSAKSVIELSLSPHFKRQHHSVARAIQDYSAGRNGSDAAEKILSQFTACLVEHRPQHNTPYHLLVLDVTPQVRPYAKKLPRQIVHQFTPTPGQKPIAVGHAISVVGETSMQDNWFLPYDARQVPADDCQILFGLKQVESLTKNLNDKLSIAAADCKYSSSSALVYTQDWQGKVLLTRLSPTRVFYKPYQYNKSDISKKGPTPKYGKALRLRDAENEIPDTTESLLHTTSTGKKWQVTIDRFDHLCMKGKAELRLYEKTISIFRITVRDDSGELIYQAPLWLAGSGKSIREIALQYIFHAYHLRFNIEHWFRFCKQQLLLDDFQTCDLSHARDWLLFPVIATHMLYHSKELAAGCHRPWEKTTDKLTPTQVKRSMDKILDQVGTPAADPKCRGIGQGRKPATRLTPRPDCPIQFKTQKKAGAGKIVIHVAADNIDQLGDVSINAHNLPGCGRQLKKALNQLIKTGASSLKTAA
jgi:DDE superfamily endonuclease